MGGESRSGGKHCGHSRHVLPSCCRLVGPQLASIPALALLQGLLWRCSCAALTVRGSSHGAKEGRSHTQSRPTKSQAQLKEDARRLSRPPPDRYLQPRQSGAPLTVSHLAFIFSFSNLANSRRSWIIMRSFQMRSRARPIMTIPPTTPATMGTMSGPSVQPATDRRAKVQLHVLLPADRLLSYLASPPRRPSWSGS